MLSIWVYTLLSSKSPFLLLKWSETPRPSPLFPMKSQFFRVEITFLHPEFPQRGSSPVICSTVTREPQGSSAWRAKADTDVPGPGDAMKVESPWITIHTCRPCILHIHFKRIPKPEHKRVYIYICWTCIHVCVCAYAHAHMAQNKYMNQWIKT